jgi:hypothetical protein
MTTHFKHNLVGGALSGEDGGLEDIEFHPCVFLEDTL